MTDSSASEKPVSPVSDTAGERWDYVFRGPFRMEFETRYSEDFDGRILKMMQNGNIGHVCTMLSFMASYLDNLAPAVTPAEEGSPVGRG